MKKPLIFVIIADLIVVFNVALWTGLSIDFTSGAIILNYTLLVLTCCIPTIYALVATRKSLDASINEALIPSLILTAIYFVANLLATALLLAYSTERYFPTIITEVVLTSVYAILLCIVMVATSHVRETYKKNNYK